MKTNRLAVNTVAAFITFSMNILISLVISPIIVAAVGGEANGFVSLANDFTNYASILTVALNSVAARFISLEYHKGNIKESNIYFNSVFWMNLIIVVVLFIMGMIIVLNLENLINISPKLVTDVKLLFVFIFANFCLSVFSTILTVATYITNCLYISSIINAISSMIRIIIIFIMFGVYSPKIWILGLANVVATFIICIANNVYRKKLIPDLMFSWKYISLNKIIEMVKSGIWSSVSKISQILSDGLDLIITNLFVSPFSMGELSLAKTISTLISTLLTMIIGLFCPDLTYLYAKNKKNELINEFKLSMKFTGIICSIVVIVFITIGENFFALWVPSQNSEKLYILSLLSVVSVFVSGVTSPLSNVFVLTNKLKVNSLIWLLVSFFDIFVVYVLLRITNLGVYAVAATSSVVGMIINFTYTPIITSLYLKIPKRSFYPIIVRYIVVTLFILFVSISLEKIIWSDMNLSWFLLIIKSIFYFIIAVIGNYYLFLDSKDKKRVRQFVIIKQRRKNNI